MSISLQSARRTVVTIGALLLVAGGSVAAAANSRPAGLSAQAYRAMMIRGEALNARYGLGNPTGPSKADLLRAAALDKRYGNAWTRVSNPEFRTLVSAFGTDVTTSMTPQQARAELARGQGLNQLAERYASSAGPVSSGSAGGFDWGDAGIGAAGAFGVVLIGAAGAITFRRRGRLVLPS
jgi:hypothetical protein